MGGADTGGTEEGGDGDTKTFSANCLELVLKCSLDTLPDVLLIEASDGRPK